MNSFPHTKRFQSGLVVFLLVTWVHLNGACPCGCFEHNYWFRILGLVGNNWDFPASDDFTISANQHDCIDKPRDLPLAAAKHDEKRTRELTLPVAISDMAVAGPGLTLATSPVERPDTRTPSHSASSQRAVLQVFTL